MVIRKAMGDDGDKPVMGGAVPTPPRHTTRDYSSPPSAISELNELVWESYITGETMVYPFDPGDETRIYQELLLAKNWLQQEHGIPQGGIKGINGKKVEFLYDEDIEQMSPEDRAAYRELVPKGSVGARFLARPPLMKGRRAEAARLRGEPTRKDGRNPAPRSKRFTDAQKSLDALERRGEATVAEIKKHNDGRTIPQIKFSPPSAQSG